MVSQFAAAVVETGRGASDPFGTAATAPHQPWRTAADDARLLRYRLFLNFDSGKHDVGRLPMGQNPIMANYARVFIRKAASYMFPEAVTVRVTAPDEAGQPAADRITAALSIVARDNDLDAADLATAVDSSVLGDGAYKVTWDRRRERVRIVPVDPQQLVVTTEVDDARRPAVIRHIMQMAPQVAESTYGIGAIDRAEGGTMVVTEAWTEERYWVEYNGQVVFHSANPYGFQPYLVFPNMQRPHEFWGLSDLTDIVDVNRALDRRLSVVAALLEISGNPVTVLENVTGQQGIAVGPGAVWELPINSKAYILDVLAGSALDHHLKYIEALYRVMDDLAEMPRMAFGDQGGGGARSGVALQIQLQPIIQKITRKRVVWSSMIERRAMFAARLLQKFGQLDLGAYRVEDFSYKAIWAPILPSDRQALVADWIALYEAGLAAQKSALAGVGVEDPDAESQAIAEDTPPPIREQGMPLDLGVPDAGAAGSGRTG